ncbi:hypothetical protein V2J09_012507 [Rumex salicifolius]
MIPAICNESDSPFGDSSTCTSNGDAYASLSMASQEATMNTEPLLSNEDQTGLEISSSKIDLTNDEHEVQVSLFEKLMDKTRTFTTSINLKMIFTPSIIAAIIGFTIGVVSPLRKLMIGDNAPLRTLYGASDLIGEAAIPTMTLIVGANLLKGLKSSEMSSMVVIGVVIVRYVALPGIGILVVKAARRFGWVGSDSLYQFVLMLQFALPPAMSVGTITQLFEMGQSDCSVIMLWSYVVASIFLTLWSTLFMSLVS